MKPTIPEVVDRFAAYYQLPGNGCWGSLHPVLDEGNVGDGDVAFCLDWATRHGDGEGAELAKILLTMSKTQRGRLDSVVRRKVKEV